MIQIDGENQVVHDKISAGYQYPSSDTVDHIETSPTWTQDTNDGSLTVTFKRLLDTEDSEDFVIPVDTEFDLGWAIRTTSAVLTSYHD